MNESRQLSFQHLIVVHTLLKKKTAIQSNYTYKRTKESNMSEEGAIILDSLIAERVTDMPVGSSFSFSGRHSFFEKPL